MLSGQNSVSQERISWRAVVAKSSSLPKPQERTIRTRLLQLAYDEWGMPEGDPIILLHGFPDDVRAWDQVAPSLVSDGHRVLAPYLRGFGPTRFLDSQTPRVGQQAALGIDVVDLMDALSLPNATLAGYDWGCTAACVAAILEPKRVRALLAIHGYGVADTITPEPPAPAAEERECWYHWYFHLERGRRGLETNRKEICLLLWRSWSPNWEFNDQEFGRTAASFENPDFVAIVINAYRHSHGNTPGDPSFAEVERRLSELPAITVPSMVLHGVEDTVHPLHRSKPQMKLFPAGTKRIEVLGAGHFVPREKPEAVVDAIRNLRAKA
jgi:pimeloyl-ACP methyl ester carboxylesterase